MQRQRRQQPSYTNGSLIYSSASQFKSNDLNEIQLKVLIIGEPNAGKTSFITRYVHQKFNTSYRATVGVDFALKLLPWNSTTNIRLQLWDIAGQERFADMTRVYYKDGVGACIVTDISKPGNLDRVVRWKNDLDNKVSLPDGKNVPCMLLANKCDLLHDETMKEKEDSLKEFCTKHGFMSWYYTSSKSNVNVDQSMQCLINEIMKLKTDENANELRRDEHLNAITKIAELNNQNPNVLKLSNGHGHSARDDNEANCAC